VINASDFLRLPLPIREHTAPDARGGQNSRREKSPVRRWNVAGITVRVAIAKQRKRRIKVNELWQTMDDGRVMGRVRAIKEKYLFIRYYPEQGARIDFFTHGNDIESCNWFELEPGDLVSFVPKVEDRGPRAFDVRLEMENHLYKKENNDEQL
jgi:cold shock CspA family protein